MRSAGPHGRGRVGNACRIREWNPGALRIYLLMMLTTHLQPALVPARADEEQARAANHRREQSHLPERHDVAVPLHKDYR